MTKLKVLHADIGGCEGCAVTFLRAIPLIESIACAKTRYIGSDFKIEDCDIAFVTGSICINDVHALEMLKNIRSKAKVVVALGSCAALGGITRFCRGGQEPKPDHRVFQPLSSVIDVDFAIPGCPPPPQAVNALLIAYVKNVEFQLRLFKAVAKVKRLSGFDLLDDVVLPGLCVGCGACVLSCPTGALRLIDRRPELIVEKCIRCGTCYVRCPRASQILVRRFT